MRTTEFKKVILLVDDDAVSRKIVENVLSNRDFRFVYAFNGLDAIRLFKENKIDLVIMDIRMPQIDGITAVKIIRDYEKSKNSHVPIIAFTACALSNDRENCLNAGMDDYIAKPVNITELQYTVEKWIKQE